MTVGDAASVASAIFTRTDCAGADANCDGAVSAPDITNTVTCVADPANCSACRVPPPVAGNWLFHELYVTPSGRGSGYSTGTGALDTNGCGNFTVTGLDNEGAPIGGGV